MSHQPGGYCPGLRRVPSPQPLLVLIFHFLFTLAVSSCRDLRPNSVVFIFVSSGSILLLSFSVLFSLCFSLCSSLSLSVIFPLLPYYSGLSGSSGHHMVVWGFLRGGHHGNRLLGFRRWRVCPRTCCKPRRVADSISMGV